MKVNFLFVSLFFLLLIGFNTTQLQAQITKAGVLEMLKSRDAEIKKMVGQEGTEYTDAQRDQLKNIINGILDFESMAKHALADTYETLSSDQRKEFVELFSTIVRDQSLNKLDIYRANITYGEISISGNTAKAETIAELKNVRTPVHYDIYKDGDTWMISDMMIDDVSTANSYKDQFQSIIRRKGYDALLTSLRKRAAKV